MEDRKRNKELLNLIVGLVFGYSTSLLIIILAQNSSIYQVGVILLFIMFLLSFLLLLGLITIYWDSKAKNGEGIIGRGIQLYNKVITSLVDK